MAILAPFPVLDAPPLPGAPDPIVDPDPEKAESRYFGFRSLGGDTLLPFTGDEFILRTGVQGLDMPKRQWVEQDYPDQDGTDLVDVKIGSRSYFLPIFFGANSGHLAHLRQREYIRSFFNHRTVDYRANGGTFDLVAYSAFGERSLRSVYVDGMNGDWDQDSFGSWWETFGLNCLAVRAYWYGARWATPAIMQTSAGAAFFGTFPGQLSAARSLGANISVTVKGDVASWPRVDLVGPASSVTVSGTGLYVSIPDGLASGEQVVIESDPAGNLRKATFNGVSGWERVAPTTIWSPLQPGDQQISIVATDPGSTTSAVVSGESRYETPW